MTPFIAGTGWVTPLGCDIKEVWERLCGGEAAVPQRITDEISSRPYPVFRVPEKSLAAVAPPHPRLRRASAISRYAAAAGMAALDDARKSLGDIPPDRMALLFAIANGGVGYTKRFFHDIVNEGAQTASPLLFPETVFNAPASHLAAILGVEGATYTVVGDGAIGLAAMKMAEELLATGDTDYCLVVGAEEADWLLCDAYHRWRLLRSAPPIEPFLQPSRGTILSEGAGAILLARKGEVRIEATLGGRYFARRSEATEALRSIADQLIAGISAITIGSANGTFIDKIEMSATAQVLQNERPYSFKPALGESVGASGLWQVIAAVQAIKTRRIPPTLHAPNRQGVRRAPAFDQAVVLGCGFNHQVGGCRLGL